ncbi:MAG: hypothetical protein PVF58_13720 [Candidatus Methanofastidiosia archaeon]
MTEIVIDTGVIIGFGWPLEKLHPYCCKFFDKFPLVGNSFYYPKKVKEELKYKRDEFSKKNSGFEAELRRLTQFINLFLENSKKLDYDNSEHNFNSILFNVQEIMKKYLQKPATKVSFDANHIANYVCFCLDKEKEKNNDHFFITGDIRMYDIRRDFWKIACKALGGEIYFCMKSIWNFD